MKTTQQATFSDFLNYNPDNFNEDYVYFKARQQTNLRQYINKRFPITAEAIACIPENIVKSFVKAAAKTFKFGFKIIGFNKDDVFLSKIYDYSLPVLIHSEQFYILNQYSGVWFYLDKDMIKTKALHCSQFYREVGEDGKTKKVIVKKNSFIKDSKLIYVFLKYEDGKISRAEAESWSVLAMESFKDIPSGVGDLPKIYKTLPFLFISDDDLTAPIRSQLITIEQELIAGDGYAIMSFYIAMLKKMYGTGSFASGEAEKISKFLGVMLAFSKLPKDSDIKTLDMGGTENQMNYSKFFDRVLLKRAKSDAVDSINITEVTKVETGAAKRQELVPVINGRNEDILFFTPFLHDYFDILRKMYSELLSKSIPEIEGFIFNDMTGLIDVIEQQDIETKKFDLLTKKYKEGVITYKTFVKESNNCTDVEADKIIKEIEKERKQDDIFNDNKSIEDIDVNENSTEEMIELKSSEQSTEDNKNIKPKAENQTSDNNKEVK